MESVLKVGRTISGGVYRAAGAVARGARRILASVPLLGLVAAPSDDDHPNEPSLSPNEATIQTKTTGGEEAEAPAPVEETTTDEKKIEEEAVAASPAEKSTPAAAAVAEVAAAAPESVKEEERPVSVEVPVAESVIVSSTVETTVTKTLLEEVDQKKKKEEEPPTTTPAQTPVVPAVVEDKKEPEIVEKVEESTVVADAAAVVTTAVADDVPVVVADNVEVSQSQAVVVKSSSSPSSSLENRVTVEAVGGQAQTEVNIGEKKKENRDIAAEKKCSSSSSSSSSSSVVERKTSEELPPPLPSSPPPTPIDPSPLERAQHAAASPSALAEALKAPAEAANNVILLASNIVVEPATIGSPSNDEVPAEKEKVDEQSSSSLSHSSDRSPPPTSDNSFSREGEEEVDRVEECPSKVEKNDQILENNFNENFIDEERKFSEEDNEAQASVVISESEERAEPLSVEEESGSVVEAKPAFVLSEDIERSIVSDKVDEVDEEIVPPLPESPIPSLEKILLEQETDSVTVFDPIEKLRASHMASEGIAAFKDTVLSPQREINASDKDEDSPSLCPIPVIEDLDSDPQNLKSDIDVCSLIVKPVAETEIVVTNGGGNESPQSPKTVDSIIIDTSLEFQDLVYETKSKSVLTTDEDNFVENKTSNEEFEVESLTFSLNSYNDSESKFNERLAESKETNGDDENAPSSPIDFSMPATTTTAPSTNDLPDNDLQKIAEPEASPVENQAEISTTESVTEVQVTTASPAPPALSEIPVFPLSEPVITEDVASVTKAIEEIDISDKAVAAAVNEAVNSNEIVNDKLHHNIIEE